VKKFSALCFPEFRVVYKSETCVSVEYLTGFSFNIKRKNSLGESNILEGIFNESLQEGYANTFRAS
jgi:hypothetical protein